VNKVALLFDDVFWPRDTKGFGVASSARTYPYFINKYAISEIPMLEAYSVGKHAKLMEDQDDEEIVEDVLNVILAMFATDSCDKEKIRGSLLKSYISRWGKEKYTQGAYTFSSTETVLDDFFAFLDSEEDVLFFGGEHTSKQFRGTVHGAYFSGQHAARQVIESIQQS
jgi:monoamine oxidase